MELVDCSRKGRNIEPSVAHATTNSKDPIVEDRSVFAFQEWLTEDFEDLFDSNRLNYLRIVPGGVADYKAYVCVCCSPAASQAQP